jgi:hypothetical protein
MRPRLPLASFAAVLVFVLVAGWFLNRPSVGQPPPAQAGAVWRYHLAITGENNPSIVVIDTKTGHTWYNWQRQRNGWIDLGTPAAPGQ